MTEKLIPNDGKPQQVKPENMPEFYVNLKDEKNEQKRAESALFSFFARDEKHESGTENSMKYRNYHSLLQVLGIGKTKTELGSKTMKSPKI